MAALEILNLYIQTFKTRVDSLNFEENIPANMRKYIASILFCDGRVEIKELSNICAQIRRRYGSKLDDLAEDVDPRIASRLTPCIPNPSDVSETLQDILRKNGVEYQSIEADVNPFAQFIANSVNSTPVSTVPSFSQSNAPNVPNVPNVPNGPNVPSAFPVSPVNPSVPTFPTDPYTPPSGGFGSLSGDAPAPHSVFPPMPSTAPDVPNVPGVPSVPGVPGDLGGQGGANAFPPMQPGMGGMSGINGMGAFPPMQPGAQKPFPSVQAPFSMDAPNQPGVDGQSDADDYMKRLRSIK